MTDDITSVLQPEIETFGGIQLRKPTAGTLSLCEIKNYFWRYVRSAIF